MAKQEESDEDLMNRYKKGEVEAFETLYERHSKRIYGFLKNRMSNRQEVDEVFQSIFLRLHKYKEKYNDSFPFLPWMFTISKNAINDYFTKNKKGQRTISLEERETEVPDEERPLHPISLDLNDFANEKSTSIKGLNANQVKGIELRYGEEKTFEEIAKALETTPVNARKIISRGIKKLRKILGEE